MASLFINGNLNNYTFVNSLLAAHLADIDRGGDGLLEIFVLHSSKSEAYQLGNSYWKNEIIKYNLHPENFVHFTVDLEKGSNALERAAKHLERCINSIDKHQDIYIDLTNGSSLYKTVLSNLGYVLGIRRQFILDLSRIKPNERFAEPISNIFEKFLSPEQLREAYFELPDPSLLDSIAPSWLTEVRRFNIKARTVSQILNSIRETDFAENGGLEGDIENAIHALFVGEKRNNGASLGGAVRYIGRAYEDFMRSVFYVIREDNSKKEINLNSIILYISSKLEELAPEYEPNLIYDIAQLLRGLRNASTHEQTSPEFGRIRARLGIELLLATSEYFKILHEKGKLKGDAKISNRNSHKNYTQIGTLGNKYFFGIDGDDTGFSLESLFQSNADKKKFTKFSKAVEFAFKELCNDIRKSPINGEILFCSGDDLLFHGCYIPEYLENLQLKYTRLTGGLTCSIGFGTTPNEAYVALKIAKASPGKNCIKCLSFSPRS